MAILNDNNNSVTVKLQHANELSRSNKLYKILESNKIAPLKISITKTGSSLRLSKIQDCDHLLSNECIRSLNKDGIKVICPPDVKSKMSIMAFKLNNYIMNMSDEEIARSIYDKNRWPVNSIARVNNTSLRITFCKWVHVEAALRQGMKIAHLSVPSYSLQQCVHIDVPQCMRCYAIGHKVWECKKDSNYTICSICSSREHKYSACQNINNPKCINCKDTHMSLAYKCPIKKDYVKKERIELRTKTTPTITKPYSQAVKTPLRNITKPSTSANSYNYSNKITDNKRKTHPLPEDIFDTIIRQTKDTFVSIGIAAMHEKKTKGSFSDVFQQLQAANCISKFDFGNVPPPSLEEILQADKSTQAGSILIKLLGHVPDDSATQPSEIKDLPRGTNPPINFSSSRFNLSAACVAQSSPMNTRSSTPSLSSENLYVTIDNTAEPASKTSKPAIPTMPQMENSNVNKSSNLQETTVTNDSPGVVSFVPSQRHLTKNSDISLPNSSFSQPAATVTQCSPSKTRPSAPSVNQDNLLSTTETSHINSQQAIEKPMPPAPSSTLNRVPNFNADPTMLNNPGSSITLGTPSKCPTPKQSDNPKSDKSMTVPPAYFTPNQHGEISPSTQAPPPPVLNPAPLTPNYMAGNVSDFNLTFSTPNQDNQQCYLPLRTMNQMATQGRTDSAAHFTKDLELDAVRTLPSDQLHPVNPSQDLPLDTTHESQPDAIVDNLSTTVSMTTSQPSKRNKKKNNKKKTKDSPIGNDSRGIKSPVPTKKNSTPKVNSFIKDKVSSVRTSHYGRTIRPRKFST